MTEKQCPKCGLTKPLTEFVKARAKRSGYHSYCKPCFNTVARESRIKHHGSTRSFHLKRRYGVDATEVEWMISSRAASARSVERKPRNTSIMTTERGRCAGSCASTAIAASGTSRTTLF